MWFAQTAEPTLYTVTTDTSDPSRVATLLTIYLVVYVLSVIAMWRIFTKAGEAGWKSIIPFYNMYTLFRIAGRNGWWFLALLVPVVDIIVMIMLSIDLAKHFGKSTLFGIVGLFFFSIVGYYMLGFGSAEYIGPKHD